MKKKSRKRNKWKKILLGATAATSLFVNNSYDNISQIIDPDEDVTEVNENEDENEEKQTFRSRSRAFLNRLPLWFRSCVLVPLWYIGYGLMAIITPLLSVLEGYLQDIFYWAIMLVMIFAVILIAVLLVFPDFPLKKLFDKKLRRLILAIILVVAIGDKLLYTFNDDYQKITDLVKYCLSMSTVVIALIYIYKHNQKVKVTAFSDKFSFSNEH